MTGGVGPLAAGTATRPMVVGSSSTGFGVENLPFGVASLPDGSVRCVSRLGGSVIDLGRLARAGLLGVPGLSEEVFERGSLNAFLAGGRSVWQGVRRALARLVADEVPELLAAAVPLEAVELLAPVQAGDFVDFSASIHHATRAGLLLRPGTDPLPPHWRQLPVGYHGRAGSIVGSGTSVHRPCGLVPSGEGTPEFVPTRSLDFEAEVGFVVGAGSRAGLPLSPADFTDHVAGVVLVDDWSARDIQAYESRPLGPFQGKSFATSVSPWLVTLDALEPYRVAGPTQDPAPAAHLRPAGPGAYDVRIEVTLQSEEMRARGMAPAVLGAADFAGMYWTGPQLLAHATANGAPVRSGDLFASGTVSGPGEESRMCLLELTEAGRRPFTLPDGSSRAWLEDGDTVVVRGWAGGGGRPLVSLGEVAGTVVPARTTEA